MVYDWFLKNISGGLYTLLYTILSNKHQLKSWMILWFNYLATNQSFWRHQGLCFVTIFLHGITQRYEDRFNALWKLTFPHFLRSVVTNERQLTNTHTHKPFSRNKIIFGRLCVSRPMVLNENRRLCDILIYHCLDLIHKNNVYWSFN